MPLALTVCELGTNTAQLGVSLALTVCELITTMAQLRTTMAQLEVYLALSVSLEPDGSLRRFL